MNRPIKLSLAIALALGSPAAFALGLGGITIKSGLNEPLVAEIAINEAAPGEADGVRANLASAEDFKRVGLDLSGVSVPLAFDVVKEKSGRTYIQVSSESPVREPFLSFLVEVSWSNGRLLREYTVLLDPPVVAPAVIGTKTVVEPIKEAPAAAEPQPLPPSEIDARPEAPVAAEPAPVAPVAPEEPPAAPVAATEPEPVAAEPTPEPAPAPAPEPAPAPAPSSPGEYGPVAAGETLWEIATATRPERDVTLNQMMLAIVRANPEAFSRGNANMLKRGAVLRIPTADEARAIAVADAAAEIAAQHEAWMGSRQPTLVADTGSPAPSGRTPTPGPARDDSRLELVPPRAGSGGTGTGADRPGEAGGTDNSLVRADLARAREQLASREQEAGELRSRVQELERIQNDKDRLVNLKDSEIAELQRRLKALQEQVDSDRAAAEAAEAATAATPAPVVETPPAATSEPAPAVVEPAPVAAEPAPTATTEPAPAEGTPPAVTGTEPVATAPTEPAPEPATVTPVAETPPAEPAPIEPRPSLPWYRNNTILIAAGSGALLLGGVLLLLLRGRRKPAPAPAAAPRNSVADSFNAGVFGGAAAAVDSTERDLLDALAADPTDLEAHLALLRHYYAAGDAEKFEGAAGAMYGQVGDPSAPAWVEACIMGRELVPGNPMFEPVAGGDDSFNFDEVEGDSRAGSAGFDLGSPELEKIEPRPEPEAFDFSLEEPSVTKAADLKVSAEIKKPADDLFRTAEFEAPKLDVEPVPGVSSSNNFFDGDDAVGTKLDLARAYLDMGDPEGARSMLQEVIAEGSDAQRQEAQRLLAEIG
jgi:pilus assembly protein FimV